MSNKTVIEYTFCDSENDHGLGECYHFAIGRDAQNNLGAQDKI
jgi:hypothetical protein